MSRQVVARAPRTLGDLPRGPGSHRDDDRNPGYCDEQDNKQNAIDYDEEQPAAEQPGNEDTLTTHGQNSGHEYYKAAQPGGQTVGEVETGDNGQADQAVPGERKPGESTFADCTSQSFQPQLANVNITEPDRISTRSTAAPAAWGSWASPGPSRGPTPWPRGSRCSGSSGSSPRPRR